MKINIDIKKQIYITMKAKTFNGCSIKFSITIQEKDTAETLIAAGNYDIIMGDVSEIIDSLRKDNNAQKQIMDVELVEFEGKPTEKDVQKEFIKHGLLFPEDIDALRFGAKYHDLGDLASNYYIIFPHELSHNSRRPKEMIAIEYYEGGERFLCKGRFDAKKVGKIFFAGVRPRK